MRDLQDLKEMEIIGPYTLLAYADDIILIGESRHDVEESAKKLIKSSCGMGLAVNEDKTKYLVMTRNVTVKDNLRIEGFTFEQVRDFKYLGVNINGKKNMHKKIRMRLNAANRCYCTIKRIFSKLLSRRTKECLYPPM